MPQFQATVQAGAALRPIEFNIPAGALGDYPATGPIPAQQSSMTTPRRLTGLVYATATQPVSQLYKMGLSIRDAELAEKLAVERLHERKQDTSRQLRRGYLQIVQSEAQVASLNASIEYLLELSALVDRKLAEPTALRTDSLDLKARLSQQRYQLLTLRDSLDSQKESMNELLARDLRTKFSVDTQPPPGPEEQDLALARANALDARSEIRQARLRKPARTSRSARRAPTTCRMSVCSCLIFRFPT
jgi:outer membrane protein